VGHYLPRQYTEVGRNLFLQSAYVLIVSLTISLEAVCAVHLKIFAKYIS